MRMRNPHFVDLLHYYYSLGLQQSPSPHKIKTSLSPTGGQVKVATIANVITIFDLNDINVNPAI